jgi:hypothetical protein
MLIRQSPAPVMALSSLALVLAMEISLRRAHQGWRSRPLPPRPGCAAIRLSLWLYRHRQPEVFLLAVLTLSRLVEP